MANLPLVDLLNESPLVREVTCPNCWHHFIPESVLWISVHPNLADEHKLPKLTAGGRAQRRFMPERFDVEGRAIDPEGSPCTQMACPRCRLLVPRASLEMPTIVLSLLGAPGSGKSVFLTSMIFLMRQQALRLGLRFQDADLTLNEQLIDDERKMFHGSEAEHFRAIDKAIRKTQLDDHRYRGSLIDGHTAKFVPPFTFLISPAPNHPRFHEDGEKSRLLCLYDNAGEHFMPGIDAADKPMTQHLAASKGLMYVFDPTKDRRIRKQVKVPAANTSEAMKQDIVLFEAANRIREHAGLHRTARLPQPLVVVLTKFDVWWNLLRNFRLTPAFLVHPSSQIDALDMNHVEATSMLCREMLNEYCPDIVNAADSVSDNVTFVPVAAVGWDVREDTSSHLPSFQAADCEPYGVLVPLFTLLNKTIPKVVVSVRRRSNGST